jgi:hypothetical protein
MLAKLSLHVCALAGGVALSSLLRDGLSEKLRRPGLTEPGTTHHLLCE